MSLLSLRGLQFTYGGEPLIDEIDLEIERGERIGLLGRNGTGKSTLMKLIAGEIDADNGEVLRDDNTTVSRLVQDVPAGSGLSVREMIEEAATDSAKVGVEDWQQDQAVNRVLSRMSLDETAAFGS